MSQPTEPNSSPLSVVTAGTALESPNLGDRGSKKIDPLVQRRKLPLGAIVSPLSPFFSERAKVCALEQAKAKSLQEALENLKLSPESTNQRTRSTSQSSKSSENSLSSFSSASSVSNESLDSNKSMATAISSMEDEQLPSNLPRISYEEWSKFGISLFRPKLKNPNSQIYYHYPSAEIRKINGGPRGNRPRSKSSVVQSSSSQRYDEVDDHFNSSGTINGYSTIDNIPKRLYARSPLTRFKSLRVPLERNYST